MALDLESIRKNVRKADTEELLDRITAYRAGMEPAAIEIIEAELDRRGVGEAQIREHAEKQSGVVMDAAGIARRCSFCERPAVERRWGWHRTDMVLPFYRPRLFNYCEVHRKK